MKTKNENSFPLYEWELHQEQKPPTLLEKITASIRYFLENAE